MAKNKKEVTNVFDLINSKFGEHTIARMGDTVEKTYDVISTGLIGIDHALGIGGLPRGRIVEIYGPESSGKTTLTIHAIANAQKKGLKAAFIDAEHAFDPSYAEKLGVDVDSLYVSQPDYGEQALDVACMLASSKEVGLIVIDSVAALTPKAEIEGDVGDHHVGVQARMMSQALRKLVAACNSSNTLCIFINQLRMKIGVKFGSPETTTGGNSLKFYASVRIDMRRIGSVKDGEDVIGNRTRVKIKKNKMAPPFKEVEFDLRFGEGFDRHAEIVELGVAYKVLSKSGVWISYGDKMIGQGRQKAIVALQEDSDFTEELTEKIRQCMVAQPDVTVPEVEKEAPEPKKRGRPKKTTQEAIKAVLQDN